MCVCMGNYKYYLVRKMCVFLCLGIHLRKPEGRSGEEGGLIKVNGMRECATDGTEGKRNQGRKVCVGFV